MKVRYPIEMSEFGSWCPWSMPIEHTINGEALAVGLEVFPSYDAAKLEVSIRNLALAEERGIADLPLPPLNGSSPTYRQFYEREIARLRRS